MTCLPRICFSKVRLALLALALIAPAMPASHAAVIFNNGGPLQAPVIAQGASFADTGNSFREAADNFSLVAGANTIRDIHWWGIYGTGIANPPVDSFSINIYDNNAGIPGTLHSSVSISSLVRTPTGLTNSGQAMYKYDAVIADLTLPAATTFWLGISDNSGGNNWAWVNSANSGGNARQFTASAVWSATNKELAFNLTNDIVPEPSTLVMGLAGIVALGLLAVKKRRRD